MPFCQHVTTIARIVAMLLISSTVFGQTRAPSAGNNPFEPMSSPVMREDATLRDICFVDRTHGWAVGDRGTILQTVDAGQNW